MKQSPFNSLFVSRGASFTVRGEWEIADVFSSLDDEYLAAREAVIAVDRSYMGRVQVKGADRVTFLNSMLSNDVKSLAVGSGMQAALLSQKGKLVSDMIVYRLDESVLLEMEPEQIGPVMKALARYIVSEDVKLEDVSDRQAVISVEGPRASELLSKPIGEPLPELPPYHFTHASIGETPIRVSAVRHGPGPGFDVAIGVERAVSVLERILDAGSDKGLRIAGHSTQNTRRIEAGIPLFGVDMNESHLLLEVDLQNAVSFSKGCCLGQEYVARLAHRGHLNRKLVGLKIDSAYIPLQGDEILGQGQPVGQVTSATFSPALDYPIALGYVHRQFFEPGTTVSIKSEDEQISARVAKLPFIDGS